MPQRPSTQEMRIDDLAQRSGVPVRNIRVYAERGLLPPPHKRGRTGFYDRHHLARLQLIKQLLERGYTLANIADILRAWEAGLGVEALLGFETAIAAPWTEPAPLVLRLDELRQHFDFPVDVPLGGLVSAAVDLGLLGATDDGRLIVRSPDAVHAGAALLREGVPADSVARLARSLVSHTHAFARTAVETVALDLATKVIRDANLTPARIEELSRTIEALRPYLMATIQQEAGRAMETAIANLIDQSMALFGDPAKMPGLDDLRHAVAAATAAGGGPADATAHEPAPTPTTSRTRSKSTTRTTTRTTASTTDRTRR